MYLHELMAEPLTIDLPDGLYADESGWSGMIRYSDIVAMTAGSYPVKPPSAWFSDPGLPNLTPLTIDDDGRVYGHIAAWHTSHIGMAGGVKPPRSKTNYAYYRTGVVKCDDNKMVDVGQITLTGGHAPLNAGVARAVAHYDDTSSAIMDVAAGEDRHGIWVSGALRPDVTDAQLRSIRASSVSGDWRPINGKLELVAVCAVNAPGFPIPRARIASGAPIALVAAGTEPLIEIAMNNRIEANVEEGIQAGLELFRERILRLENVVLADGSVQDTTMATPDVEQLRKRVRGGSTLAATLRDRVRGGKDPVDLPLDSPGSSPLAASLRERVKGADADPKAPAPEALTAARPGWNPLLHPRGADGRFIEVGSWVRWLRQGFGSTRRGHVVDIIPDPNSTTHDGVPGRALARVEFPDRNGKFVTYDVPFDELEKVAPPKGSVDGTGGTSAEFIARKIAAKAVGHLIHDDQHGHDNHHSGVGTEDGNDTMNKLNKAGPLNSSDVNTIQDAIGNAVDTAIAETVPSTPADRTNPTDVQLAAEELANLGDVSTPGGVGNNTNTRYGLIKTPYVPPSDEWSKTTKWFDALQGQNTPESKALVDSLRPEVFSGTDKWANAVRQARSQYEGWRATRLEQDQKSDVSLNTYLGWLDKQRIKASMVAGLRSRVRGTEPLIAHATDYWTPEKRAQAAKDGTALPSGEFPIEDVEDLKAAIEAFGRATQPFTTKRHIIKRANLLGSLDMLPTGWVGTGFDPAKHLRGSNGKFVIQGGHPKKSGATAASLNDDTEMESLRGRVHETR